MHNRRTDKSRFAFDASATMYAFSVKLRRVTSIILHRRVEDHVHSNNRFRSTYSNPPADKLDGALGNKHAFSSQHESLDVVCAPSLGRARGRGGTFPRQTFAFVHNSNPIPHILLLFAS